MEKNGIEKLASLINIEQFFTAIMLALVFGVFSTWRSVEKLQWQLATSNETTLEHLNRADIERRDHEERIRDIEDWRLKHDNQIRDKGSN